MKFGITHNDNENSEFPYKVWFRRSDGKVCSRGATKDATIGKLIEVFGEEEAGVQMKETKEQTDKEKFLERL